MIYSAPKWLSEAIFYQIFPERFDNGDPSNDPPGVQRWGQPPTNNNFFGGDLQGILNRIPYLHDLGINAIYLTPIFKARTNHRYDTCDYLEIDPCVGDLALFRKLVETAHASGIRIVLDAVFNHCGDGFWAFEDLRRNGAASAYRDWFFPHRFPVDTHPVNYQTCGGADFLPKLNTANREVRDYLLKVAAYWIREAGIDGWRLDVPWKAEMDFWPEFHEVVKKANPDACILGEIWRDPLPWLAGDTCDGIMNYPLRDYILDYCVRDAMDAEDFHYFSRRLLVGYAQSAPNQLNLLGSHDTPRILSVCRGNIDRAILAFTALFTQPGMPMVYYGDDTGMEGENDPDCRRCMDWNESHWNMRIHQTVKQLIQARHQHPSLSSLTIEPLLIFNGVYAFHRTAGDDEAMVILNPREAQPEIRLSPSSSRVTTWRDLYTGKLYSRQGDDLVITGLHEKTALVLLPE
jgi:glycosidase